MKNMMSNWVAPSNIKTPDFIICGAMKSGTTTLHAMLNKHPDVFIPDKEIHFFDRDNLLQHADFNDFNNGNWCGHYQDNDSDKYWQWYGQQFSAARSGQVLGEDSTTYLASPLAAKRIAMQNKAIKLIVMLRQPSKRAYSQYWHLVRSGRALYSFEQTLQLCPSSVLSRSMYLTQITELLKHTPKERVKFIIFEQFIADKIATLKEVCEFIGVPFQGLPANVGAVHENITTYPKYTQLQLLKNRLFPLAGNLSYQGQFMFDNDIKPHRSFMHYVNAIHRKINPLVAKKPAATEIGTKRFLDDFFQKELDGLNELLDRDVLSLWFK
jgi:sulfotransferase family protein